MKKRFNNKGFTLVELMVALVVFGLAMAAATSSFLPLVGHFTQQSKIAETQMESMISLDVLRDDVSHAGYGLPQALLNVVDTNGNGNQWDEMNGYDEVAAGFTPASNYNDGAPNYRAPRAFVLGNNIGNAALARTGINGSDYLVIRSTTVRKYQEAGKWTYVHWDKDLGMQPPHVWLKEDMVTTDLDRYFADAKTRVVFMKTVKGDEKRLMVVSTLGADYYTNFEQFLNDMAGAGGSSFQPSDPLDTYLIYAVGDEGDTTLRMPFNRADYYINAKGDQVPVRCAGAAGGDGVRGTNDDIIYAGVLMKAVVQHNRNSASATDGKFGSYLPLFDCVADMQVIFGLDMDDNGTIGTFTDDGTTVVDGIAEAEGAAQVDVQETLTDAVLLRNRLKEVRIYILAHEGQRDPGYSFNSPTVEVGEFGIEHLFNLQATLGDPEYKYYRWLVYSMVIAPENLR